jgi:hypothetical protein
MSMLSEVDFLGNSTSAMGLAHTKNFLSGDSRWMIVDRTSSLQCPESTVNLQSFVISKNTSYGSLARPEAGLSETCSKIGSPRHPLRYGNNDCLYLGSDIPVLLDFRGMPGIPKTVALMGHKRICPATLMETRYTDT